MPEDPAVFQPSFCAPPVGHPRAVGALIAGLALAGCLGTAACGVPPELDQSPSATRPTPTPTGTVGAPTPGPTPTLRPTPGPTRLAACAAGPSPAQVTALLRRSANLPRSAKVTFQVGPLCVEDWQYSIVVVTGREPLQAVTRGQPGGLRLVTAGTDVCNIPVRAEAPPAIRAAACDAAPSTAAGFVG